MKKTIKDELSGFNIIKVWEDLDCVDPIDDEHYIAGNRSTLEEAMTLANELYSPFGVTYIVNSMGNRMSRTGGPK